MDRYCLLDDTVGVLSGQCPGGIDFTVALENYVLILIPAACLLLLAPLRLRSIWSRSNKVFAPTILQAAKSLSALCFAGFSLAVLIVSAQLHGYGRQSETTAAAVSFVASLVALTLSSLEHHRSIRPSALSLLYLIVAVIVESVHLRTVWIRSSNVTLKATCFGQVVCCATFLVSESVEKESILLNRQTRSPQDVNDLFSDRLFWWLNSLFKEGYRKILAPADLYTIDEDLASPETRRQFRLQWLSHYHRNKNVTLLRIVCSALRYDVLFPIVPRLLLLGVSFPLNKDLWSCDHCGSKGIKCVKSPALP